MRWLSPQERFLRSRQDDAVRGDREEHAERCRASQPYCVPHMNGSSCLGDEGWLQLLRDYKNATG